MNKKQFKNLRKAIKAFDADRVAQVYKFLNWKWYKNKNEYAIPTCADVVNLILELASDCVSTYTENQDEYEQGIKCVSAGIEVAYLPDESGFIIRFVAKESYPDFSDEGDDDNTPQKDE